MSKIRYSHLGWKPFFQQQLTLEQSISYQAARVVAQHKSCLQLATIEQSLTLALLPSMPSLVTGDWILIDDQNRFVTCLERQSLTQRKGAGSQRSRQLIGANLDYVFVLMSLNHDFNLNRLERYLAMVSGTGIQSVVILTKADQCDGVDDYVAQVQKLDPLLCVRALDTRNQAVIDKLSPWCNPGSTIGLMGSSGVGKSTLVNTLMGGAHQLTGAIREQDSKGKHTTTGRELIPLPNGALLMDTPGMRELKLTDCAQGIEQTFSDITALTQGCRFQNCQHISEPGCAILDGLSTGTLDARRWQNYSKLVREQVINTESLVQKRAREKGFSRKIKLIQAHSRRQKQTD